MLRRTPIGFPWMDCFLGRVNGTADRRDDAGRRSAQTSGRGPVALGQDGGDPRKVLEYLAAGVEMVWIVDPYFYTVTVHRPTAPPEMFNNEETLSGGATLPGFEIAVAELFR